MNRILCFTDLSDGAVLAIKYGNMLANKFGSELFICHVIELPQNTICDFQWDPVLYLDRTISDSEEALQKVINRYHIDAEPILRTGCIESEIPSVVSEKIIDLVIFPFKIKTGPQKIIQKRIISRLVKSISCPLLIVPYKQDRHVTTIDNLMIENILICCGPSFNLSSAFENVMKISEIFSAELHFLHILNRDFNSKEVRIKTHGSLTKTIEQLVPGKNQDLLKKTNIVLKKKNPTDQLLEYSKNNSIDMIFLDTTNYNYNKKIFSSSSVMRVILQAQCPVLLPNSKSKV